jgi:hypothetical protein
MEIKNPISCKKKFKMHTKNVMPMLSQVQQNSSSGIKYFTKEGQTNLIVQNSRTHRRCL